MRAGGKPLVLLVDDSEDSRVMYATYLTLEGFEVHEAADGVQAIASARDLAPDAVVMDLGLPQIDGVEATKTIREDPTTREIVILALSGHAKDIEERALVAGVDRFVRKPCLPEMLVEHLRELLASRRRRRSSRA